VDVSTDFAGNRTDHDFDAHGHLLKKVEGAGTPLRAHDALRWDEAQQSPKRRGRWKEFAGRPLHTRNTDAGREWTFHDLATGAVRTTTFNYTYHGKRIAGDIAIDASIARRRCHKDVQCNRRFSCRCAYGAGHATTYSGHNNRGQAEPRDQPGRCGDRIRIRRDAVA
jgi:hypothetical protein